jgi:hypothetical protein
VAKVESLIGRGRNSDDYPKEDLAKLGYKLYMKYEYLLSIYIFGSTLKTKYKNLVILTFFSPSLWQLRTSKLACLSMWGLPQWLIGVAL